MPLRGPPVRKEGSFFWLPDGAGGFAANHCVAGFAIECRCKLGHVRKRAVDTPFRQRMRICRDLQPCKFGRFLACPNLRPAEEETLLIGKSVYRRGFRLARFRLQVGRVSDRESSEIADVVAKRQLAVDEQPGLHFEAVKLLDDARGSLIELFLVFGRPPTFQVALGIEAAALIVESV